MGCGPSADRAGESRREQCGRGEDDDEGFDCRAALWAGEVTRLGAAERAGEAQEGGTRVL
jgi:hypothetical protein